jgi:hypothetical protein
MIYSNINENIKMKWWVIIVMSMSASSLLYSNQLTRTGTLSLQVAFFNSVTSSQDKSMIWQEKHLHCKRKKLTISTFQKINKCLLNIAVILQRFFRVDVLIKGDNALVNMVELKTKRKPSVLYLLLF